MLSRYFDEDVIEIKDQKKKEFYLDEIHSEKFLFGEFQFGLAEVRFGLVLTQFGQGWSELVQFDLVKLIHRQKNQKIN